MTLGWTGLILMLIGLIDSLVYWRERPGKWALAIALLGMVLWFTLFWFLHPIWGNTAWGIWVLPRHLRTLLAAEIVGTLSPVMVWIVFQIPLVLIALWRCCWPRNLKIGIVSLLGICLGIFLGIWTMDDRTALKVTPRISSSLMSSMYQHHPVLASHLYDHKRLIVIGTTVGQDEGLLGGGPPRLDNVVCRGLNVFDAVDDGQKVMIMGTCEGMDDDGRILLSQCHIVKIL